MIIYYIDKRTAIKPVDGSEYFFCLRGHRMIICEPINAAMQRYSFLNEIWVVKSFSALYKITDRITHHDARVIKRKVSMCQVIHEVQGTTRCYFTFFSSQSLITFKATGEKVSSS
jgi:hypothetical protein